MADTGDLPVDFLGQNIVMYDRDQGLSFGGRDI